MGTPQEALENHRTAIEAISEAEISNPNLATTDIFGEASELVVVATEDYEQFRSLSRFDLLAIDTLQERIDAYMLTVAQFEEVAMEKGEAREQWLELEPKAYALKRRLMRRLRLFYEEENNKQGIEHLNNIAVGRGRRDLTMDFLQLSELTKKEQEALASLGFTADDAASVGETFESLKALLGSINAPVKEVESRKLLMQQAYTYLHEAVSSIRRYGQLIFADDEVRLKLYKSEARVSYGEMSYSSM